MISAITASFWALSHCHILVSVLSGIMSVNLQVVFFSSIQHKHMSCHFITFRVYYVACFIYVIIYFLLVYPLTTTMVFSLILTHWAHSSFSRIPTVSTETNYYSVRNFVCWFTSRFCVSFLNGVPLKFPLDGWVAFLLFLEGQRQLWLFQNISATPLVCYHLTARKSEPSKMTWWNRLYKCFSSTSAMLYSLIS